MVKNILVITGSPRKNGNSSMLADAFIKGALKKGHTVNRFDSAFKTIGGCRACDACWSKGNACFYKDGFSELAPMLENADAIVFVSPLYWFGMSAQLKAAIDKMYAYDKPDCINPLKIKESLLLTCAAEKDTAVFEGIIGTYRGIVNYLNWSDAGVLAVPSVYKIGEITHTGALEKAELLGSSL